MALALIVFSQSCAGVKAQLVCRYAVVFCVCGAMAGLAGDVEEDVK